MNTIGARLQHIRKSNRLRQVDFAKAIGISQGTLSDIEKDKCKPSVETLISVKGFFDISIDWLLTGNESKPSEYNGLLSSAGLDKLSSDEINIIRFYRMLSNKNKIKIEGIMEEKIREQKSFKKGRKSFTLEYGEETAAKIPT